MKQGRALAEVLAQLLYEDSMKRDFIAPAQALQVSPDGESIIMSFTGTNEQEVLGMTDLFHRQVGSALNIPAKYYDMMRTQKPQLLAENVNAWLGDRDQSYMIRSMDFGRGRVARAFLSDRYRRIDNLEGRRRWK